MAEGPREPVLPAADIQGNSLAGFRKDQQHFSFLRIVDVAAARAGLAALVPHISPLSDVAAFNALFRSMRARRGEEPGTLGATWANIAFTASGLSALSSPEEVEQFDDAAFRVGMAARSGVLGDPVDPDSPGHVDHWLFGGTGTPVDAVLIVASDTAGALKTRSAELCRLLTGRPGRRRPGFEVVYAQKCATRRDLPGHEHFGFKDGISQPGPRGRLSRKAADFLTPRLIDPADPRALRFGRPGQPLVWPGEFVLGLARQDDGVDDLTPLPALRPQPRWARNGSYLVVRRLRQDVDAFWGFARTTAAQLARRPGFQGMTPEHLASLLIGRWPSGAPLVRAPSADDPALGRDSFASNDFGYESAAPPTPLRPEVGRRPDLFPAAVADPAGLICPHAAHVRKVNPRDQGTDIGGPRSTLRRLMLRRGITFGSSRLPFSDAAPTGERGLLFASYQASIVDQFEFISAAWANSSRNPTPGGVDLVIGQVNGRARSRRRALTLIGADGSEREVATTLDWALPTGGGYFFSPSISALRDVLSAPRSPPRLRGKGAGSSGAG